VLDTASTLASSPGPLKGQLSYLNQSSILQNSTLIEEEVVIDGMG
jgi:hypothetical protein